ncbi:MAG: HEPN domain-containing protein [Candidatus Hydrogenedentes bacterium]|nr:HEPN domain-containing protein [Candidatus Hydrogenedentota bacterium]
MINIDKHVQHWLGGVEKSWEDAELLLKGKRYDFGAYAAHLALEKILKAHVTRVTGDIPPRTHDLRYLAKLSEIPFSPEQDELFQRLNEYQLEGRYPEVDKPPLIGEVVLRNIQSAREMFKWLKQQL